MYESGGDFSTAGKVVSAVCAMMIAGSIGAVAGKDSVVANVIGAGFYLFILFLLRKPLLKIGRSVYRIFAGRSGPG